MPILKRLRSLDWPALAVELVLIFVGITAALWFDNVNQSRAERRREAEVLTELASALASDTSDLNLNLGASARALSSIDTILRYFDQELDYDPSLAEHFRQASTFTNFIGNSAAYEYLKSVGLSIIQNDSLRLGITQYYEVEGQLLHKIEAVFVNGNWDGSMRPEMMQKFDYNFFFGPAVPHDYPALRQDREYRTALTTTRGVLEWKDRETGDVIARAEELLASIRAELSER